MKKITSAILSLAMAIALAACGGASNPASTAGSAAVPAESAASQAEPAQQAHSADGMYEIAMITDKGNIDDKSFNQGTWEGVQQFAAANNKTCQYYKPIEVSDDAYLESINLAIKGGAKVVVTPGFLFSTSVGNAQNIYPDVKFVLIDGEPAGGAAENSVGVLYTEEQSGYLAGYAAVKDGYTKLGFMGGMAVPAIVRFGFGYVQGANDAAKELGITVDMKYFYTGGFEAAPEWQAMASAWYQSGTEVIFTCGGSLGYSVFAAAEANNAKAIGVDVDQSAESETIITSAVKGLRESVNIILEQYYAGAFPGGQMLVMDAANNAVGLPMETSRFNTFSQDDYANIYSKLVAGYYIPTGDDSTSVSPLDIVSGFDVVNIDYVAQ